MSWFNFVVYCTNKMYRRMNEWITEISIVDIGVEGLTILFAQCHCFQIRISFWLIWNWIWCLVFQGWWWLPSNEWDIHGMCIWTWFHESDIMLCGNRIANSVLNASQIEDFLLGICLRTNGKISPKHISHLTFLDEGECDAEWRGQLKIYYLSKALEEMSLLRQQISRLTRWERRREY